MSHEVDSAGRRNSNVSCAPERSGKFLPQISQISTEKKKSVLIREICGLSFPIENSNSTRNFL